MIRLAVISALLVAASPAAAALKKVIIVDIYNSTRDSRFDYLSNLITSASRKQLKKRFAFKETDPRTWKKKLRSHNFTFEEEYHSRSVSLQNGLLNSQDLVICGYFDVVVPDKETDKPLTLVNYIYLIDVNKRKVFSEIKYEAGIDDNLFKSIDYVAEKISVAAHQVLPNRDQYSLYAEDIHLGMFVLKFGTNPLATTSGSNDYLSGSFNVYPDDLNGSLHLGLEYRYTDFLTDYLNLSVEAEFISGERDKPVQGEDGQAQLSQSGVSFSSGVSYSWYLYDRVYFLPSLSGGYQLVSGSADFGDLANAPLDTKGNEIKATDFDLNFPFVDIGLGGGLELSDSIAFEANLKYRSYISGVYTGQFFFQSGLAVRLD